jgi:hypothetical protein
MSEEAICKFLVRVVGVETVIIGSILAVLHAIELLVVAKTVEISSNDQRRRRILTLSSALDPRGSYGLPKSS